MKIYGREGKGNYEYSKKGNLMYKANTKVYLYAKLCHPYIPTTTAKMMCSNSYQ